jgi:hypothetical protein
LQSFRNGNTLAAVETTPLFELADSALDGQLAEFIRNRRDHAASWDAIARELFVATGHRISVTGATVRNWYDRFLEPQAKGA